MLLGISGAHINSNTHQLCFYTKRNFNIQEYMAFDYHFTLPKQISFIIKSVYRNNFLHNIFNKKRPWEIVLAVKAT